MAVQTLFEQRRINGKSCTHSISFWRKTVDLRSFYTKIGTIARSNTCNSCSRRAFAVAKKSAIYRLLQAKRTRYGIQTPPFSHQNLFSVVNCPSVRQYERSNAVCPPACTIVQGGPRRGRQNSSAKKRKSLKILPIVTLCLMAVSDIALVSILCVSVGFVELLFRSLNSAAITVRMANHFRPGHPPFIPGSSSRMRELKHRDVMYFMRAVLV